MRTRIEDATRKLHGVHFSIDESGELKVSYHARIVEHHSMNKAGERPAKRPATFYKSLDPDKDGFVLTSYLFDHKPSEPPRAFQAVQKVGPVFEFGDFQVKGADKAVNMNFRWGREANSYLIAQIRKAITEGTTPLP